MLGKYQEVPCTEWQGSEGSPLWNGACMAPVNAPLWPSVACGNEGMKFVFAVMQIYLMCALRIPTSVSGRQKIGVVRITVRLWTSFECEKREMM